MARLALLSVVFAALCGALMAAPVDEEAHARKYVFSIGGYNSGAFATVYQYNIASKVWGTAIPLPGPRNANGAAPVMLPTNGTRSHIPSVIMGGGSVTGNSADGVNTVLLLSSKEIARGNGLTWQSGKIADMLVARTFYAIGTINNHVYAAGGLVEDVLTATMEKYDPHTNKWTMVKPMPQGTHYSGFAVLNGHFFVCGGNPKSGQGQTATNIVQRYYAKHDTWKTVAPLNLARLSPAASASNGQIFVTGGQNKATGPGKFDSVEAYNFHKNTWTILTEKLNSVRAFHNQVTLPNGELLICGGEKQGNVVLASCESFDPKHESKGWALATPMPAGVAFFAMVVA